MPLKSVNFVDIVGTDNRLVQGRPFVMIEGPDDKRLVLNSPITGDVFEVNSKIKLDPSCLNSNAECLDLGWIMKVDAYVDPDESDEEWDELTDRSKKM